MVPTWALQAAAPPRLRATMKAIVRPARKARAAEKGGKRVTLTWLVGGLVGIGPSSS